VAARSSGFRPVGQGPLLTVCGVGKSFRRRPVLTDVSLQVHAGEVVTTTGENGGGKTTLLRICAGLERPDRASALPQRGSAAVAGADGQGWMVRLNCWVACCPLLSVSFMVKVKVPAVVGVPASWLLVSEGPAVVVSASPGGSWPDATDQV